MAIWKTYYNQFFSAAGAVKPRCRYIQCLRLLDISWRSLVVEPLPDDFALKFNKLWGYLGRGCLPAFLKTNADYCLESLPFMIFLGYFNSSCS